MTSSAFTGKASALYEPLPHCPCRPVYNYTRKKSYENVMHTYAVEAKPLPTKPNGSLIKARRRRDRE